MSQDRFAVTYWIAAADAAEAKARALDLALEQTVEIPGDIVPAGHIADEIVGRIENIQPATAGAGGFLVEVSFSDDTFGDDFLQFLNVVFGNSSLKAGLRVEHVRPSAGLLALCAGPKFGHAGLRRHLGVSRGPLLLSATKPMGLNTEELADIAYRFALGGMDMVKDDHGLTNQRHAPFEARIEACVNAVARANRETGGHTKFVANITGPADKMLARAKLAQQLGAGGVMLAPALVGYDAVRMLAADESFNLPILSHPSFGGANVIAAGMGFSHAFYFGELQRLMGIDAVIYPNFGGRFGFSEGECLAIAAGCRGPYDDLPPILPCPGGGMTLDRVPEMQRVYGEDVVYLMGGSLLRQKDDLPGACRALARAVGRA